MPILKVGRNCRGIDWARHASVLVDADAYFSCLDAVLRHATHSVLILGWDFDAAIRLRSQSDDSPTLATLLRTLVEQTPELEVRILVWNLSTIHAPGETLPLILGADWHHHPRIHLWLDHNHPIYGSQHQKIVCVDDRVAFVGGIDLTVERWDTPAHAPHDARRQRRDGTRYEAVHDVQMVVDGQAAEAVAAVARYRMQMAVGEAPPHCESSRDLMPVERDHDFADVPIAISRTIPASREERAVHEIRALTIDCLRSAERSIYIEAQYFADHTVADVLEANLRRKDGPQIVVVTAHTSKGLLERWSMGSNRDRMIRRLRRADNFDRFRAYYPVNHRPDADEDQEIFVHSKLMIIDDRLLRIGSANLNRRSTGLDTECDLSIEAATSDCRRRIALVRARLLSEHLGADAAHLAETIEENGLIRAVEELNCGDRRLHPFDHLPDQGPVGVAPGTWLFDPAGPLPLISRKRRRARRLTPRMRSA